MLGVKCHECKFLMPVGRVFNAAQNQVLISPVSSYYEGKAKRANIELRELQGESLKQELEDAPARKAAANAKAAADYALVLESIRAKRQSTDAAEMDDARDVVSPWVKEYDKRGIAWARENFDEMVLSRLPASKRDEFAKAKGPDGILDEGDMAKIGLMIAIDEVDQNPDPTTHQKMVAGLVEKGFITEEQGNQILLDIEKKAGTIVGTTAHDPGGLTATGINKVTIDFRNKVGFAATGAQSATELVKISYEGPAALGKSGAIVTFGNELFKTAKNLMDLAGKAALPPSETKKQDAGYESFDWGATDKEIKTLGLTAAQAAQFKSGIYSIAFSAAVGEQGSRPSDKDIQQYIAIYGGNITDANAFRATIDTAMTRQYNMLKNTAALNPEITDSAASLKVFEDAYAEFKTALKGGSGMPTISSDAEYDALPSGTVFKGPDGKTRRKE